MATFSSLHRPTKLQQQAAMLTVRDLLVRLSDPKQIRRIPRDVRREARTLLRQFPSTETLRRMLERELGQPSEPIAGKGEGKESTGGLTTTADRGDS